MGVKSSVPSSSMKFRHQQQQQEEKEKEVELGGFPGNENTNEKEENSFVAYSLLMFQQAQNNSISTRQSNKKFPEYELDIELIFSHLE